MAPKWNSQNHLPPFHIHHGICLEFSPNSRGLMFDLRQRQQWFDGHNVQLWLPNFNHCLSLQHFYKLKIIGRIYSHRDKTEHAKICSATFQTPNKCQRPYTHCESFRYILTKKPELAQHWHWALIPHCDVPPSNPNHKTSSHDTNFQILSHKGVIPAITIG